MDQPAEQENKEEVEVADFVAPAIFVPGRDFFNERIAIPDHVSSGDVVSFLETQLEVISPFNADQLAWGALLNSNSSQAFIYATLQEGLLLEQEDYSTNDKTIFPSFLPFLHYVAEAPGVVCAVNGKNVSLIVFDEANEIPAEVHSIILETDDVSDELIKRVRADFFRELPWVKLNMIDEVFRFHSIDLDWKQQIKLLSNATNGGKIESTIDRKQQFLADLRDLDFKNRVLNASRLNYGMWMSMIGALGLIGLLSILSVGKWIWDLQIQSKMDIVDVQQEKVATIERKSRNLSVFESGSATRLQPLAMLEIINRKARPDGLYFSKVTAFEGRRLDVEGFAEQNGTALVNQYKQNLSEESMLANHTLDITRINQGSTFFKLIIEFNDLELAEVGAHK